MSAKKKGKKSPNSPAVSSGSASPDWVVLKAIESPVESENAQSSDRFATLAAYKAHLLAQVETVNSRYHLPVVNDLKTVRICVNMIVRMESKNVQRVMDSTLSFADAVVVVNTEIKREKDDDTTDKFLAWYNQHQMPGQVHRRRWTNDFGINRTEALRLAETFFPPSGGIWYVFFIDADDYACGPAGYPQPFDLDKKSLTLDSYKCDKRSGDLAYDYTCMVRYDPAKLWEWKEDRHEYLSEWHTVGAWSAARGKMFGSYIKSNREGYRAKNKMTYLEDALCFEKRITANPKNGRARYYAGQSWRDSRHITTADIYLFMVDADKTDWTIETYEVLHEVIEHGTQKMALKRYLECAEVSTWAEENYCALKEAHCLYDAECLPLVARLNKAREDKTPIDPVIQDKAEELERKSLELLFRAMNFRPERFEAPFYIIELWRAKKSNHRLIYDTFKRFVDLPYPQDQLFVDANIHRWRLIERIKTSAHHCGDIAMFEQISMRLLKMTEIPDKTRGVIRDELVKFGRPGMYKI